MSRTPFCLLLAALALPAFAADTPAANRISVQQLEEQITSAKNKKDADEARQLASLDLSERLSTARFRQLKALLPGEKSEQALLALADKSSFLQPPASDIPATAAPDLASQRRMLALTVNYLAKTLPLLPNLFATRETRRFEGLPSVGLEGENDVAEVDHSAATVFFRDGQEFVDAGSAKGNKKQSPDVGLTTWGEFGSVLGIVVTDAARSNLKWGHWELGDSGPAAVFQYSVPKEKSHYDLRFCCITEAYGFEVNMLTLRTGYHGEITVDPDSGVIERLTIIAESDPGDPIRDASILIEYGPQQIGSNTYICPTRGIALAETPNLKTVRDALAQRSLNGIAHLQASAAATNLDALSREPKQVLLNDVAFREYHLFHVETSILNDKQAAAAMQTAASAPPAQVPAAESATPAEGPVAGASPAPAQQATETVATNAPAAPVAEPPAPTIPEIYVTETSGLPQTPAAASVGMNENATVRIDVRNVDVPLVVTDKKGHPVTDFTANDLEVYDNGVKVDIRSLVQANATAGAQLAPGSAAGNSPEASQPEFSNRVTGSSGSSKPNLENTLVLLLDGNLSWDDFVNVREQMEEFLKGMQAKDRVAIYIMRKARFQILQDVGTDHQQMAAALAKYTPSAENIQLGQEQEARNRQSMDYVNNVEDLLSVNGNEDLNSGSHGETLDPKLKKMGDNPGDESLYILELVARHLAAMPGHKSLVWIASDNVLADWDNSGLNMQKGDHFIEPAALRVQEAMNDAHVSVYPLDASRLEAGGIGADIASTNVELNPASAANQVGACGNVTAGSRAGGLANGDPALGSGPDLDSCAKNLNPGRMKAQMQQDLHSIQGAYREIADATGGRALRRASDYVKELNDIAEDDRATYLLSFSPTTVADNKYHLITIKLAGHKNATLRYRTGYFYGEKPSTLKDRFRDAALEPEDVTDIGLTASALPDAKGQSVKLLISATDLALARNDALWTDKLDIFLVQRELSGAKAQITGQCMNLRLQPGSYEKYLKDGIPFDQAVEAAKGIGSIRIVVLDENSGHMGSVTIPVSALGKQS